MQSKVGAATLREMTTRQCLWVAYVLATVAACRDTPPADDGV